MCLPPGVSCYRTGVKLSQESCSVPCQGIYADVVNGGGEDLHTKVEFKPVFDKYKEYKSGFIKDQGKKNQVLPTSTLNLKDWISIDFIVRLPNKSQILYLLNHPLQMTHIYLFGVCFLPKIGPRLFFFPSLMTVLLNYIHFWHIGDIFAFYKTKIGSRDSGDTKVDPNCV